jgi:hypothetical protein
MARARNKHITKTDIDNECKCVTIATYSVSRTLVMKPGTRQTLAIRSADPRKRRNLRKPPMSMWLEGLAYCIMRRVKKF